MMRTLYRLLLIILVQLVVVEPAHAEPPPLLPVTGYLTDDADAPRSGWFKLRFKLFDNAANGTELYAADHSVSVEAGRFVVYLGEAPPLNLLRFRDHAQVFLEVVIVDRCGDDTCSKVEAPVGVTLSPRVQLATAPYAAAASYCGDATTVGGMSASAFAPSSHQHALSDVQGTSNLARTAACKWRPGNTIMGGTMPYHVALCEADEFVAAGGCDINGITEVLQDSQPLPTWNGWSCRSIRLADSQIGNQISGVRALCCSATEGPVAPAP